MVKNVVYIQNVSRGDGRSTPYHYSVSSWKAWCKKNDVILFEMTEPLYPHEDLHTNIQKWWAPEVLDVNLSENSNKEYQIAVVDADTIIHPDAPNFFNLTEGKFCAVKDNGSYEWINRSIFQWGVEMFPHLVGKVRTWSYWNSGFVVYSSKKHRHILNKIQNYFTDNLNTVERNRKKIKASADQTITNYLLLDMQEEVTLLPECWNLQHMVKKDLLHMPEYSWWPDRLLFLESGWVYHFNGIPNQFARQMTYWMERTYTELYKKSV